jgi:hypothetical protein
VKKSPLKYLEKTTRNLERAFVELTNSMEMLGTWIVLKFLLNSGGMGMELNYLKELVKYFGKGN